MGFIIDFLTYFFIELPSSLSGFMDRGGTVLWLIALLALFMWILALERFWYYRRRLPVEAEEMLEKWKQRQDHTSWYAKQIRLSLIGEMGQRIKFCLPLIGTLVALAPLLGLLGTVTGMIEVFHVMAVTGGGDAKAMAGGVSRATIPTMAGMVVALSGVFARTWLTRLSERKLHALKESFSG